MKTIEAWHFLPKNKQFRYGDGNIAAPGYVYSVEPPIKFCSWGLHASIKARDALKYAPGPVVGRVILSGEIIEGGDKCVATHREYLWIADATDALRDHARWCAMQVINLWDAPDIVRRYLKSGDESLRAAAWAAAEDAAWDAAVAAGRGAGRGAAMVTARNSAWATQEADLTRRLMKLGE